MDNPTLDVIHEKYLTCLRTFAKKHFPNQPNRVEELLVRLPEVLNYSATFWKKAHFLKDGFNKNHPANEKVYNSTTAFRELWNMLILRKKTPKQSRLVVRCQFRKLSRNSLARLTRAFYLSKESINDDSFFQFSGSSGSESTPGIQDVLCAILAKFYHWLTKHYSYGLKSLMRMSFQKIGRKTMTQTHTADEIHTANFRTIKNCNRKRISKKMICYYWWLIVSLSFKFNTTVRNC